MNKVSKAELLDMIAKEAKLSKKDAGAALNATVATIVKTVSKGDSISLINFGVFSTMRRAARKGHNPQTGESIKIPASKAIKFSAGKAFKDAVNKRK